LKVTVPPALPKMHRVEVARSDLPLVRACMRAWVCMCVSVEIRIPRFIKF